MITKKFQLAIEFIFSVYFLLVWNSCNKCDKLSYLLAAASCGLKSISRSRSWWEQLCSNNTTVTTHTLHKKEREELFKLIKQKNNHSPLSDHQCTLLYTCDNCLLAVVNVLICKFTTLVPSSYIYKYKDSSYMACLQLSFMVYNTLYTKMYWSTKISATFVSSICTQATFGKVVNSYPCSVHVHNNAYTKIMVVNYNIFLLEKNI